MTDPRLLQKRFETPTPPVGGAAAGLPADIARDASSRLGWAALAYSVTFFFAFFGPMISMYGVDGMREHLFGMHRIQSLVSVLSILLGVAVYLFTRYSRLAPAALLDLGLIF